jgi:uncharacterized membrane protein (DUF2068 family)
VRQAEVRGVAGLRAIAIFKLAKAVILLVLGIATLTLLHKDVGPALGAWATQLHLDPDGRFVQSVLERGAALSPGRLRAIAGGMFFYAGLLGVEGVGLFLGKRWAEYFTVFATASLVPLEIYEIVRRPTVIRVTTLVVNVIIVGYLIARLRRRRAPSADLLVG